MPDHTFFMHEDDWGEIELLPVENRLRCLVTMRDLRAFQAAQARQARAARAYVLPDTQQDCTLLAREIPLFAVQRLLDSHLQPALSVQSGGSAQMRVVDQGYAFGEGYGELGALYGTEERGTIHTLNVLLPQTDDERHIAFFAQVLTSLATSYDLFLLDWWHRQVVSLRDVVAARAFLRRCADELGSHGLS